MTEDIKVVNTPAPDLPNNVKDRLRSMTQNGMVTMPSGVVKHSVLSMAAVLIERGEKHVVEDIIHELADMHDSAKPVANGDRLQ